MSVFGFKMGTTPVVIAPGESVLVVLSNEGESPVRLQGVELEARADEEAIAVVSLEREGGRLPTKPSGLVLMSDDWDIWAAGHE